MGSDKIELEKGSFDWGGRGYEAPAGGGGYPPGWFDGSPGADTPSFLPRSQPVPERPAQPAPPEPKVVQEQQQQMSAADFVEEIAVLVTGAMGVNWISVSNNKAHYEGHDIDLSEAAQTAIREILSVEVCSKLDAEKERVIGQVLNARVPTGSGGGRSDVPEVQGAAPAVEPQTPVRPKPVRRVRRKAAHPRASHVRRVPRKKAGKEGPGSNTQPAVPSADAGSGA